MNTYLTLLRGINVSGHKPVKMPELKKLYEDLGFHNVLTYIQSGNVIFRTEDEIPVNDLFQKIEKAILSKFGFDVPVIIRTNEELKAVLEGNPFRKVDGTVADKIYITFLEDVPFIGDVEKINSVSFYPDRFVIAGKEIYIDCATGYGTTKLSNTFFEKKLNVMATTRNWKTLVKLAELAGRITDSELSLSNDQ